MTLAAVDVRNEKVLAEALNGVTTVYFCLNVPYQDWYSVMPEALERVTRQLKSGQTLVFPGNIYGYGKLQYLPADERHPKEARTRKGKLRNQLEELLKTEAERRGFRYVIPRYPNYYGPNVTNRLFGPIFSGALQAKTIKWPVKLDVPHDLVYIRDAARAAVLLAESGEQGEWHVSGSGAIEGRQFLMNIHHAAGSPGKCCAVPSWAVGLAGVFNKEISEFHELLYEFEYPLLLNDNKFMMRFPEYNPTSYKRAIRETIEWFREELG